MKVLAKKLGKAEVKCRCIIIPRDKKDLFPAPDIQFEIREGKAKYPAKIDKQYRLRSVSWFREHRALKASDEVTFYRENGSLRISLLRSFSRPEKETFDWILEVIEAIRGGEIYGVIRLDGGGFSVEIGDHVNKTEVVVSPK
jgi:hypothetical protein